MKILIVEDSPLVQKMYGLVFSRRDHEMVTALNGRAALDTLVEGEAGYDLILLDLRMPDMNGAEFIQAVQRRGAPFDTIPIVLTTAEPDASPLLIQARGLGVAGVVRKPWKPQELREAIRQIVPEGIR